jgi:hypothetical protein
MLLEWTKVSATNKWEYSGEMIYFKGTGIDLLVTPNHKMLAYYEKNGNAIRKRKKVNGKFTKSKETSYFIEAKDVRHTHVTPKIGFKWIGNEPTYFILPELITTYNKQRKIYPPQKIKIEDWLAFFGLWIAEGCVRGSKGGKKIYSISIKQKKPRDEDVRELLKILPFHFTESIDIRDIVNFEICNKQLWDYFKQFGNSHTKYIPKEIKNLSPYLLKIFLKWYLFGDGTISNKNTIRERIRCYTVSKQLKDDLMEISLKVGGNISGGKDNTLRFLKRKTIKLKRAKKIVYYDGFIYGIEVEKNHTLCLRRNNKIIFSGNSMKKEDYGEKSISAMSLVDYYKFIEKYAKGCYNLLDKKGIVAFLIQNQTERDIPEGEECITHTYNSSKIFEKCGFKLRRIINCPQGTQQIYPQGVIKAKEENRMLGIVRDLLIFEK